MQQSEMKDWLAVKKTKGEPLSICLPQQLASQSRHEQSAVSMQEHVNQKN